VILNSPAVNPQQPTGVSSYAYPVGAQSSSYIPQTLKMPATVTPGGAAAAPAQTLHSPASGSIPLGWLSSREFGKTHSE